MFKAIGFDYGGVIAGIHGSEFGKRVSNLLGVKLEKYQNVYFRFNHLLNNNVLTPLDFWKKITGELGVFDKYDELIKFMKEIPHHKINEQVVELADKLRAAGYKTGLLSNNTIASANRIKEADLASHFDAVVVSAEIGVSKPHPKVFEIFIKRLGVLPSELVFIDDTEQSLATASEVGFCPVLFVDYQSLLSALKSLGIKV